MRIVCHVVNVVIQTRVVRRRRSSRDEFTRWGIGFGISIYVERMKVMLELKRAHADWAMLSSEEKSRMVREALAKK